MNHKRTFLYLVLLFMIGGIVAVFLIPLMRKPPEPREPARIGMQNLLHSLQFYQVEYGRYPSGDSSEISKALLGSNPKKIVFLNVYARSTNSTGQFVDPWGTPYEIAFGSNNHVTIRSAGQNKILGDADDVAMSTSHR